MPAAAMLLSYRSNRRGPSTEHLHRLGVLGPNVSLTHMVHVDANGIELLAHTGTNVIHCPLAALMADRVPPPSVGFRGWRRQGSVCCLAPMAPTRPT